VFENPVIEVGRLFPSMDEFRICFRIYAVKSEFETKTLWTYQKKFYARYKGFNGGDMPCKWYISARRQPGGRTIRVNQIPKAHTCITSSQKVSTMTSQLWVAEKNHSNFSQDTKHQCKEPESRFGKAVPNQVEIYYSVKGKAKGNERTIW
jgi:hypothetical protein